MGISADDRSLPKCLFTSTFSWPFFDPRFVDGVSMWIGVQKEPP
jgi:hypothetical protein